MGSIVSIVGIVINVSIVSIVSIVINVSIVSIFSIVINVSIVSIVSFVSNNVSIVWSTMKQNVSSQQVKPMVNDQFPA